MDLLDAFGDEYILDHITNHHRQRVREEVYRTYITDALMCISGRNAKMDRRYVDVLNEIFSDDKDDRTAEQIISGISNKLATLGGKEE